MESDIKITPEIIQKISEMQEDESMSSYIGVINILIEIFMDEDNFVDGAKVIEGGYSKFLFILRNLSSMKKDLQVLNNSKDKE